MAEAATAATSATTSLGFSHGCIHIDPRERDEMVKRGHVGKDIRFIVRRWDEHLLPNEIRQEMIGGTASARNRASEGVGETETATASIACSDESSQ